MMKKEMLIKRKYENLANKIYSKCQILVQEIRYTEFIHKVSYENGIGYCENLSERMLSCSEIEKCHYKSRIKVVMTVGTTTRLKQRQRKVINKILRTNVQYRALGTGYTEISFNVNPHNM